MEDSSVDAKLSGHLSDLSALMQELRTVRYDVGRIEIMVDRAGRLVSQNAAASARLGLRQGDNLADLAIAPDLARRFLVGQAEVGQWERGPGSPIPLLLADPAGGTILLLGQPEATEGHRLLSEVQRGIDETILSRLSEAAGLIASESQILKGLIEGKPIRIVAQDLGRTEGTVRQQLKSVMAKMGVNSQQQLISIAYALSLMDRQPRPTAPAAAPQGATLHEGRHGVVGLHVLGPADGMPVLLLHGALFGIAAMPALQDAAATLGLRLIAPERPGYGHTALPDGAAPDGAALVALATRQATEILDKLGIQRVVVVAHDIGTRFAAELAAEARDRVAAVIAAPATPPMQTWTQTADMPTRHRVNAWAAQHLPGLMDKIVSMGLAQVARKGSGVIPQLVFDGCDFDQAVLRRSDASAALQEAFALAMAQSGVGFRADMRLTNENWQATAPRIAAPFLCLHGSESRTVSRNAVEQLAQMLPKGRFRLVEGAGHSLPVSHPALILRAALAAGQAAGLGEDEFGFHSER